MARIVQVTNDGTRTETTTIYMASSFRLAKDRFELMRKRDQEEHKDSFVDINSDSYSYNSGVLLMTISVLMK